MGIYLNPDNAAFAEAIRSKIYVDKTGLIAYTNSVLKTSQKNICVSRPRRFGKSITANMLAAYYSKGCDSQALFDKFVISKKREEITAYRENRNQYDVIALNMQEFMSDTPNVDAMISLVSQSIIEELKRQYSNADYSCETRLTNILKYVNYELGCQFIFIIDEWDCIFRENKNDLEAQKKYLDFLRNLLKDKVYVALAYMTGILPIKKYGTHSALNMFDEYSMTNPRALAKYVGFTESEVKKLCIQFRMDFDETKRWYDGYQFSRQEHIYSPKSVVDAMLNEEFDSYWTQTETYEALKIYLDMNFDGLKDSIVRMLAGEHCRIDAKTFQNDMTTFQTKDDVLTLLVHLGYLAYDLKNREVFIPNMEINEEFARAIRRSGWDEIIRAINASDALLHATWNQDAEMVAKGIDEVHMDTTSILTYNNENSLSCVISIAYYAAKAYYTVIRELPTGKGFADVVFLPRRHCTDKPAMIVELKWNKSAFGAIAQVKERNYVKGLEEYQGNLLLVGINYNDFEKKHECVIEQFVNPHP